MKVKFIFLLSVLFIGLYSCNDSSSSNSSNATQTYSEPAPRTRMDGVAYFYNNFDEFKINLGSNYGSHRIKSVTLDGNYMKVRYAYKNGVLRGNIEPNGSYTGSYTTSSTSGTFDLRFQTDGTAFGSWQSEGGFMTFSGSLAFEN